MTILRSALATGELGCEMELPSGSSMQMDGGGYNDRLVIFDEINNLTWSVRFFENLHMDLRNSMRSHLKQGIEK